MMGSKKDYDKESVRRGKSIVAGAGWKGKVSASVSKRAGAAEVDTAAKKYAAKKRGK